MLLHAFKVERRSVLDGFAVVLPSLFSLKSEANMPNSLQIRHRERQLRGGLALVKGPTAATPQGSQKLPRRSKALKKAKCSQNSSISR